MLGDFLKRLMQPEPQALNGMDFQLALAALLVRLAKSDGYYSASEIIRVEAEAPDTVRFTRAIKDAVPYEERVSVIEVLWQVALADGERDQDEDALVRLVTSLLGVSDKDSAMARQKVAKRA